jgi:serine protease Do
MAMSHLHPVEPSRLRNRILTSTAVLSLVAAGAIGEGALTAPHTARAAAVVASDLKSPAMPSFAPLIARVKPAVVAVKVNIVHQSDWTGRFDNLPPEIQRFFKQFGEQNGIPANPRSLIMGEGSGFFISSDGYIVTNDHVVQESKSVTVTTDEGKVIDAKVVGTDPKTDLALLKVDQPGDYPYVTFAKEAPKIGDWVVAIGNPYGLGGTVTAEGRPL